MKIITRRKPAYDGDKTIQLIVGGYVAMNLTPHHGIYESDRNMVLFDTITEAKKYLEKYYNPETLFLVHSA